MNQKGHDVLKYLIDNNQLNQIVWVVSSCDEDVRKDYYLEIKELCQLNSIRFFDRKERELPTVKNRLAIGWRWMINNSDGLIVLHDSLLPKYRGFAPLVSSLINGEKSIGVTALFASDKFDCGDILIQKSVDIKYPIKIKEAIGIISEIYKEVAYQLITNLNELVAKPQDSTQATYSCWRDFKDYFIKWNLDSVDILRFIDAVGFPYLGAKCYYKNEVITILECELYEDLQIENRMPGKFLLFDKGFPVVVCGKGTIILKKAVDKDNEVVVFNSIRTRLE